METPQTWRARSSKSAAGTDFYDDEHLSYRGWEVLRLMGGVDLRSSPFFGVGVHGGVAFGRYDRGSDGLGDSTSTGSGSTRRRS